MVKLFMNEVNFPKGNYDPVSFIFNDLFFDYFFTLDGTKGGGTKSIGECL